MTHRHLCGWHGDIEVGEVAGRGNDSLENLDDRLANELGDRAHVCIFSDAAHAPHLERAEDVNRLIIGFLGGEGISCVRNSVEVADRTLDE